MDYSLDLLPDQSWTAIESKELHAQSELRDDLLEHLASFGPAELTSTTYQKIYRQLVPFFEGYARTVFDAYAEECIDLFCALDDAEEYITILEGEVVDKIVQTVLPSGGNSRLTEWDVYNFWIERSSAELRPLRGLWEEVLNDCWQTLFARKQLPITLWGAWDWRVTYALRYADVRDRFPYRLQTLLAHRIPHWRGVFIRQLSDGFDTASEEPSEARNRGSELPPNSSLQPRADRSPGEVIGAWLDGHGESKKSLADRAGIARNTLSKIIKGKRVRSEKVAGVAEAIGCHHTDLVP